MDERLIESLSAAVRAAPADLTLRLHLAGLLVDAGRGPEAVEHAATVLAAEPGSLEARDVMSRAMGTASAPRPDDDPVDTASGSGDQTAREPRSPAVPTEFDWHAAESDVGETVGPMFVDGSTEDPGPAPYDVELVGIRLADVGGLSEVKKRLEASFLAPLRNPELRRLYGKSLRGGLLLYGPPGCGKTYLAKAVAGELGASFIHVSLADVLDMYIGQSERNVKELFEVARSSAPCVLFLDELDAIGQKRSLTRNSGTRTTVNQLLTELDGVGSDNEGVFVLAATNHPWDVDPALRRPGRLDRTLLVLPPDREAREAILRTHLRDRPVERIDTRRLAKATEGFSGADLAHLCESASENALMESVGSGKVRMIGMADFDQALSEIRPSIGPWMETARNVALYANASGEYDDLAKWLRKQR
ncbi:AAA family ATPase [Nocardioides astragali]|uniref:AAA family ATPase n=1 Tax=Nocardioides astragali TaxID=1776736 RepID=A0ABW2N6P4_9ACTN|nr:AAA family ATPase [Nocardioides astragali]